MTTLSKRIQAAIAFLVVMAFSGSVLAEENLQLLIEEARKASTQILTQIRGEVVKELERTGPIRAVIVCKYSAPEITSAISRQTGMRVTRVALKVRNRALGEADPWEQKAILNFEKKLSNGEKVEAMEFGEIVTEPAGKVFRYAKAIPVAEPCLECHGPHAGLSDAVKMQLANEYPFDKAVGFKKGQIRGAVSVKKSL